MTGSTEALGAWDLFVLRHHKPANLALHLVSALMFFGSPVYGLISGDWTWFAWFCLSGCIGTGAHYLTRDGTVTLHEASSSPRVVAFNVRLWWRILTRRYGADLALARARLAAQQTSVGRTALVTGASSGFGEATVRELLARGFRVVATLRRLTDTKVYDDLTEPLRGRLTLLALDVTDPTQRDAITAHVHALGRLDLLVCNAGYGLFGALDDLSESDLRRQMEVNFFGVALLTRALAPCLRSAHGTLVHLSSPAGVAGFPWTSAYCASKHALEGLTESLAYEFEPHGVAVHLVTPGAHRTQFMAKARWVSPLASPHHVAVSAYRAVMERNQTRPLPPPQHVANVIADLAERRTVGLRVDVGTNVRVLRGMVRFLPAWLRHRLVSAVFRRATRAYQVSSSTSLTRS